LDLEQSQLLEVEATTDFTLTAFKKCTTDKYLMQFCNMYHIDFLQELLFLLCFLFTNVIVTIDINIILILFNQAKIQI
jgi:hypothetical protein